jgi:hypothetical protein
LVEELNPVGMLGIIKSSVEHLQCSFVHNVNYKKMAAKWENSLLEKYPIPQKTLICSEMLCS